MTRSIRLLCRPLLSGLFAAAALLTAASAPAQTTIHVPVDQPTIQAGINAAHNGDTVLVAPGTYYENIDFLGKAITVTSSGGAATTIIDGGHKGSTVTFQNYELRASILSNFTIQNGQLPYTGNPAAPFEGGQAGGGIFISAAAPTILNNIVRNNYCNGILVSYAAALLEGNTVSGTDDAHPQCMFGDNAPISLDGSTQNSGLPPGLITTVIGNVVENNDLQGYATTSQSYAAGIGDLANPALIENNIVRNNNQVLSGGGIRIDSPIANDANVIVSGNLITGNSTQCGAAGLTVEFFSPNQLGAPRLSIVNNTIVNNLPASNGCLAGATQVTTYWDTNQTLLANNILVGSSSSLPVIDCTERSTGLPPTYPMTPIDHNDIFNPTGAAIGAGCSGENFTYGNLAVDPLFKDPVGQDFHLQAVSPLIDSANNAFLYLTLPKDLDNNPRAADAHNSGSAIVDFGAYEYPAAAASPYTQVTLAPDKYFYAAGSSPVLTAVVTSSAGIPSGSVEFAAEHVPFAALVLNASGAATTTTNTGLAPGVHRFSANFTGSGSSPNSQSNEVLVLVDRYQPHVSIMSSLNPSFFGQSVTLTATISSPDGAILTPIVFSDGFGPFVNGTVATDSHGVAMYTTSALSIGSHYIQASYAGDAQHSPASAALTQSVIDGSATTTTLTANPATANVGQAVTLFAHVNGVSGTPDGMVLFSEGATTLATLPLDTLGNASYTTSSLALGSHLILATYKPAGTFTSSFGSATVTITNGYPTTTAFTSAPNPSPINQPVTLSAHVTSANGTPNGSITFSGPGGAIATVAVDPSGNASTVTSALPRGTDTLTATYVPSASFAASSATTTETINGLTPTATLALSPATTNYGQTLTLTATITTAAAGPPPTGTVQFFADGNLLSSAAVVPNAGGFSALIQLTSVAGGHHIFTCLYNGDVNYNPAPCAPVSATIAADPTTLQITDTPRTAYALAPVTLTSTFAVAGGSALVPRSVPLVVDSQTVSAGSPTGSVSYTFTPAAGPHTASASFAGDNNYAAASAQLPFTVLPNPTSTSISASPQPAYQGQTVTVVIATADTTGPAAPYGTLTLLDGSSPVGSQIIPAGSANASITASFPLANPSVGAHQLTATYSPADSNFLPSSAQLSVTVLPSSFTLSINPSSLSIQTEHHKSVTVTVTSTGMFSSPVSLSCATPLPPVLTCSFAQTPLTLTPGIAASTQLTLETDAVPNFYSSSLTQPTNPRDRELLTFAALLPVALFAFTRRRSARRFRLLSALIVFAATAAAFSLTACGDKYPDHTPPGVYDIEVDANDTVTPPYTFAQKQTAHITLTVTP